MKTREDMSEAGKQMYDIWEEFHDPFLSEQKKLKENRERRERQLKEDAGL